MKERAAVICRRGDEQLFVRKEQRRWNLPGGRVEAFETPHAAAYHKPVEETGIIATGIVLLARFTSRQAMYFIFAAETDATQGALPAPEIADCVWLPYKSPCKNVKSAASKLLHKYVTELRYA